MSFTDLLTEEDLLSPDDIFSSLDVETDYEDDYGYTSSAPVLNCWKGVNPQKPPKSFGSFYGKYFYDGDYTFTSQFLFVCRLNGWTPSRFKTYTSMVKWLRSNNAPDNVLENVYRLAYAHFELCHSVYFSFDEDVTYNTFEEFEFLFDKFNSRKFINAFDWQPEIPLDPDAEF